MGISGKNGPELQPHGNNFLEGHERRTSRDYATAEGLGKGDQQALDELTPMVYAELRRMAGKYARGERAGNSLQATALVNEVYLRMVEVGSVNWQDRAHSSQRRPL